MNFSNTKKNNLTKKCQVRAFNVNLDGKGNLFQQISTNNKFVQGSIIQLSTNRHLKLKEFSTKGNIHYLHFSLYNPKEEVSITPNKPNTKDLLDVENFDNLHAFFMVKDNQIASLLQISTNWSEVKIAKIFKCYGIDIIPSAILKKNVIQKVKDDGLRAVHVNFNVHESDFVNKPSFLSVFVKKEPKLKQTGISGHFTIDARGNPAVAASIENNPTPWISDLNSDFYFETKKGEKITSDDMKLTKIYHTLPYGSQTISSKYAHEILEHFVTNEL
ncbi:TPA: hypothetical protein PRT09_004270 [Escherichia coli]|nr:hypothetical protein [Escherichia coli]